MQHFPNQGTAVEPIAIRYVEDRNGNIVINPERELRDRQKKEDLQIMTPQEAYIMVSMLQSTVKVGTLKHLPRYVDGFARMPMGGKTGNHTKLGRCLDIRFFSLLYNCHVGRI